MTRTQMKSFYVETKHMVYVRQSGFPIKINKLVTHFQFETQMIETVTKLHVPSYEAPTQDVGHNIDT